MKKIIFLSVMALGLMASCSEDELMSNPLNDSNAIAFATQTANKTARKAMTRSAVTINSIDKFTVSALLLWCRVHLQSCYGSVPLQYAVLLATVWLVELLCHQQSWHRVIGCP